MKEAKSLLLTKRKKSLSFLFGQKEGEESPPWKEGVAGHRALKRSMNSQGPSLQDGVSGANGVCGATAWRSRKTFRRPSVNIKCCTNGNNNATFYLTSSLRTQSWAGRLLMKSAESTKLGIAGDSAAQTSKHPRDTKNANLQDGRSGPSLGRQAAGLTGRPSGIFLTQESNRDLLYCRQILQQLSYQGSQFKGNIPKIRGMSPFPLS